MNKDKMVLSGFKGLKELHSIFCYLHAEWFIALLKATSGEELEQIHILK